MTKQSTLYRLQHDLAQLSERRVREDFFVRQDVVLIAKELIGKYLVTHFDRALCAGRIVETEAYKAPDDKASHAYNNRLTPRTQTMFKKGGIAYVYLCYGLHHLFNVVTGPEGMAHAVLIRAVEPVFGQDTLLRRRNRKTVEKKLTAGPAVLTQALGIRTGHDGLSLYEPGSPVWIADDGYTPTCGQIEAGPRIGVDYAGECAMWEWRFWLKGSPWVSK